MGDIESPRGPTGPEADGRNLECSRSRRGVGTRRGWSTLSSVKKRGRSTGTRSPDASPIRTGGRFTNTAVFLVSARFDGDGCWQQHLQICNAIAKSNGWTDETAALQLFELLLFTGKAGGVQKKIREGNSPNWSGSCHVCHGAGYFGGPRIWGYGHLCLKPDGPGQVYCRSTELWAATSPRQCSSGYAHPRDSGSLPIVGESFGVGEGVSPRNWLGPGTFGDVW